jgi:hypothetical protein
MAMNHLPLAGITVVPLEQAVADLSAGALAPATLARNFCSTWKFRTCYACFCSI